MALRDFFSSNDNHDDDGEEQVINSIRNNDCNFSVEEFKAHVSSIFLALQDALENKSLITVKDYISVSLYNFYSYKLKDLDNLHNNLRFDNVNINDIKLTNYRVDGAKRVIEVKISASLIEYIVNNQTGKILDGNSDEIQTNNYRLEFINNVANNNSINGNSTSTTTTEDIKDESGKVIGTRKITKQTSSSTNNSFDQATTSLFGDNFNQLFDKLGDLQDVNNNNLGSLAEKLEKLKEKHQGMFNNDNNITDLDNSNTKTPTYCPNCGAAYQVNNDGACVYCNSIIGVKKQQKGWLLNEYNNW